MGSTRHPCTGPTWLERARKPITRAAVRGAIGAMAMSGLRQASANLGLIEKVPPEGVLERTTPRLFHRVPPARRPAVVELVHWLYGTAGGALFGALPRPIRRHPWAGPVYGLAFWGVYQAGVAPALGLPYRKGRQTAEGLALLVDHLLYGVVVAVSPWPNSD